ncbi:MAG: putative flagellin FliC [Pseudomonadota bacterium]|jgi:flagellin
MGLRVNTNIAALSAQRHMGTNNASQHRSLERLASGSRINKAGDDAAGLAISEKLKSHLRSMKQATRNANDGVSLVQVAEGAMNEISNILIRMRELSIQASSDTIGDSERAFVDKEIQSLKSEVNRIANSTEFNGTKLLNNSSPPLDFQVGIHNNADIDRFVFDTADKASDLKSLGITELSSTSKSEAQGNLRKIDDAMDILNRNRASLGALQNRLASTINNLHIYSENLSSANSRIRDTDMAEESSELTKSNILTQATVSVLTQANQNPQLALKLIG